MADSLALVLMVAAVAVLLTTALVWIAPLLRRGSAAADERTGAASGIPGGPLAKGFGYLFSPLGLPRRRTSVGLRLDRALQRIAAVDPYATSRRIGLALLPTVATETDPESAAPAAPLPWPPAGPVRDERETPDD